ncbi:MAG: protein kinase domain-containing protein [Acidobacteriota bacterium]
MATLRRRIQRFEVAEQLGAGGMGSVYRAWDPQLERDVAIKVLAESARDPALDLSPHETLDLRGTAPPSADDLLSEARMMARLSHPNVLPVYEVGLADGAVFVVMEHIAGANLREWLEQPHDTAAILDVFAQAAQGLAAAHARGIVHRDFKPENVLIGRDGRARVADFGLSRLSGNHPGALVRIDDGRGTPRYMAPELWRGDPATLASDVFAYCTALREALGDQLRGVPARLRAVIEAGISDDPAKRPGLTAVLDAMAGKSRSRWWIAGGAAAVVAVGIVTAIVTGRGSPSCDDDPGRWTGKWGEPERGRVAALAERDVLAKTYIPKMLASLDEDRHDIDAALRATCKARAAGEVSEAQATMRRSCLERRVIELGSVARWIPTAPITLGEVENRISSLWSLADCTTLVTAPLPADRAAVTALYDRYDQAWSIVRQADRVAPLAQLERDAATAGETELALRAAFTRGVYQRTADDLTGSDATLRQVYQRALELHASDLALASLVERGVTLGMLGKAGEARDVSELAATQAEQTGVSLRTRVRVYGALGSALVDRGDYLEGARKLQQGLELVASDGHRMSMVELGLRFRLIDAFNNVEERQPAAVKLARDTVEFTRDAFGEHYVDYGTALNKLAYTLVVTGDPVHSIEYRRQAIAVFEATMPPGHSSIVLTRSALASDLYGLGEYEEARQIWSALREPSEHNDALRANRAGLLCALGEATFALGRFDEGLGQLTRGLDEMVDQYGRDHHWVQGYKRDLAEYQLALGRTDDAARTIAALEESYQRKAESRDIELARLHGRVVATLDVLRGKPREAEQLTRAAIGSWDELHGDKTDRASFWLMLGWELSEQHRWDEAREALERARTFARTFPADELARIEARLARVDLAQGHRAEAIAEATHASAVLAKFRLWNLERNVAAAVLAGR